MEPSAEEKRAFAQRAAEMEAKYAARQREAAATLPAAALPDVRTTEQAGEISMNVDDTNKLRAALGLAPLVTSTAARADEAKDEHKRHLDAKSARERKLSEEAAREKIATAQERRRLDKKLKQTKTLGEDDEHGDDVGAWLRAQKEKAAAEGDDRQDAGASAEPGEKRKRQKRAQAVDPGEHDVSLNGVKVKGSAVDLEAGETMILTLADTQILAEDGNIAEGGDVLENYDKVQQAQIDKAKRKARKKNLHYEEDGKVHNLLSKYDEEEAEVLLDLEADATVNDAALKAAVAARLEASAAPQMFRTPDEKYGRVSEYMSAEEAKAAAGFKKRKKRDAGGGRKARRRATDDADEDATAGAAAGGGASLFDELEAAAVGGDEGHRGSRSLKRVREEDVEAGERAQRSKRFDMALEKANYAALARRARDEAGAASAAIGADEAELELEAKLAQARSRSRRQAVKEALEGEEDKLAALADGIRQAREGEEAADAANAFGPQGDVLGETHDFVSGLVMDAPADDGAAPVADGEEEMETEAVKEEPSPPAPEAAPQIGGWVAADAEEGAAAEGGSARASGRKFRQKAGAPAAAGVPGEDASTSGQEGAVDVLLPSLAVPTGLYRRGVATALQMLRDTGALKDTVKDALLDDESELAAEVAAALQRKDEFGRILTPKESFRDISYAFHGMQRAVSKKEKNMKAVKAELAAKSALSADNPSQLLDMYKAGLWKPPGSKWRRAGGGGGRGNNGGGKGKAGKDGGKGGAKEGKDGGKGGAKEGKDGGKGGAKEGRGPSEAPKFSGMVTPMLGGRDTPLEGANKVEAMFPGLKRAPKQ